MRKPERGGDGMTVSGQQRVEGIGKARRVAELLHGARPVLLDTTGGAVAAAAAAWADRVDVVTGAIDDAPAGLLIRPDGYIAWAADTFEADDAVRLRAALTRWFGP